VEGLVHISELAPHHVENPREVVQQGQAVNVRILEIDGERRRLSLSLKRVEEGEQPVPRADGGESVHATPDLKLSEEAFPTGSAAEVAEEVVEEVEAGEPVEVAEVEVAAEAEVELAQASADEIASDDVVEVDEADEPDEPRLDEVEEALPDEAQQARS
jgi:small subunit ribosomal protein S1